MTNSSRAYSVQPVPDCRIALDGKKLALQHDARLTRVVVDLAVDVSGQCVLAFNDPQLTLINGGDFRAGASIRVELGFAPGLQQVFEGEIVALEPQFRRDCPAALYVVCQEAVHRLALSSRTRSFNEVDGREIAGEVARERGLRADAAAGTKEHVLQGNISDAELLRRLARAHGKHVRVEGKKLVLGPPPRLPEIPIGLGDGLKQFKLKIAAAGQVSEVSVHGWDAKSKREIVGRAKADGEMGEGGKRHGRGSTLFFAGDELAPADVATAEAMAKGRMQKLSEDFVTARVEMEGNPGVLPGAVLVLDKVDLQLDGKYRVDAARHEFSKHGYRVTAKVVRVSRKTAARAASARALRQRQSVERTDWRPPVALLRSPVQVAGDELARADGAAQAEALVHAAKDGTPFCEKCEAARRAAEAAKAAAQAGVKPSAEDSGAAPAPPQVHPDAAAAQAAALRGAAQSGAAFCEKCEAARKALAAAKAAEDKREETRRVAVAPATPAELERQAAAAQASALTDAAKAGSAFCEKCEAAKRALAAEGRTG